MDGEEGGGGEAEVEGGGIGVGDIERMKMIWNKSGRIHGCYGYIYIIALLFEPIMIPDWDKGYMGGSRPTWFKLSVIQDISIELLEYK